MDSTSNKPRRWTGTELDMVKVGQEIHEAVVDEGRREGVFAYLVRDGRRGWFEKYDRRTREIHRRFSPTLAARIKANRDALKLYVEYLNCQAPVAPWARF